MTAATDNPAPAALYETIHNDLDQRVMVWWEIYVTSTRAWSIQDIHLLMPNRTIFDIPTRVSKPAMVRKVCAQSRFPFPSQAAAHAKCYAKMSAEDLEGQHFLYKVSDMLGIKPATSLAEEIATAKAIAAQARLMEAASSTSTTTTTSESTVPVGKWHEVTLPPTPPRSEGFSSLINFTLHSSPKRSPLKRKAKFDAASMSDTIDDEGLSLREPVSAELDATCVEYLIPCLFALASLLLTLRKCWSHWWASGALEASKGMCGDSNHGGNLYCM
eukprot:gnl/MRDRNA2_/MRDRNA2_20448_c0_seq1.p1 gnl/MRDRNA2_/MRDRNA2_20448_c0~~gnl/MRDRNA2_/MRDRNA2_20448_c0_seq1.p1  ORF type:complete len:273 (-),score=42.38 gnl/MRDRNA2_/MRDRNA2_20448_c0_seq1:12-830(-)